MRRSITAPRFRAFILMVRKRSGIILKKAPIGTPSMTESDVRLANLPEAVQNAFKSSQYADWHIEDLDKYERTDRTFYLIEIEKKGQRDRKLFYAEDGKLLKDEHDRENDDVTPTTTF